MAKRYEWFLNPFQDFLMQAVALGADVSDKSMKNDIDKAFVFILEKHLINKNDTIHLDFEITNKNGYFKLVGKNSVSALWLSGIIPMDTSLVLDHNVFLLDNREYRYNRKTCKLTYKIIK